MKTRVFELAPRYGYANLTQLAEAMGISLATVSRVRADKRQIGAEFIAGAMRAFPNKKFEKLFYVEEGDEAAAPSDLVGATKQ